MAKEVFDQESYEQDLALMMLDVLVKKNEISFNTYKAVKRGLLKEEEHGELCNGRTAKIAG